jgi:hypothetical protein
MEIQAPFITGDLTYISASQATTESRILVTDETGIVKYRTDIGSSIVTTFNRQTASYTLVESDANKLIEMNVASANTLTIPSSSTVNFATGSMIDVVQYGAGQTTITSASNGVTIRSANNWVKINARYGAVSLVKVDTDEWYLFGNLNA